VLKMGKVLLGLSAWASVTPCALAAVAAFTTAEEKAVA